MTPRRSLLPIHHSINPIELAHILTEVFATTTTIIRGEIVKDSWVLVPRAARAIQRLSETGL